jgi:hypothetical protein
MGIYPLMDIRFSASKEAELVAAMQAKAASPWCWQTHDAFGRPPEEGSLYFHRDGRAPDPPCTLCIRRKAPGHLVVDAVVPDAESVDTIPLDRYVRILREFDSDIAGPLAESFGGMTSLETASCTPEDYFSPTAVRLLERFCTTSNAGDLGSHLSDQEKWMDFLLQAYADGGNVHCDVFGECVRAKGWWPEAGISRLVREFDFAMRLMAHRDRQVG